MDDKTLQLRDKLLLLIIVFTVDVAPAIRFDWLYRPFDYGYGTICDLLKSLVSDGLVAVSFDVHEKPSGYPDEFLSREEQVKKLHLCFDQSTYIYLTPDGRDYGVKVLQTMKQSCKS